MPSLVKSLKTNFPTFLLQCKPVPLAGFATSGVPVSTSKFSTAAVPSSSSSTLDARLIAAIVVPVTVALIGIFVVVLFLFVWYVYNHIYISSMIYIPVLYLIIVNTINLLQGIS